MASQTEEAERHVREQRALIQRKITTLKGRVGDDISHARARLEHHVTHAADTLPGGPQLIEKVEQHPAAALAGGLGLGVAAGMLGGGGSSSRNGASRDSGNGRSSDGGSMFIGTLANNLLSPLRPYMEDAARQVMAGFGDRQRAGSGAGNYEASEASSGSQSGGSQSAP